MNKREDALLEALQKNAEETDRWKLYLMENEKAKENISMFQKNLSVDVMVPVGKKALMPGHLIHTNELLVGHYQGYFSKCSAFRAGEICDLRIKTAKEHLSKLEKELELWQNKLEKPYTEGMLPTGDEQEIIEDYNEEQERLWREQHKYRLKQEKQKEKHNREKELAKEAGAPKPEDPEGAKSVEDLLKLLEEAELMEELENELESLDVDEVTDETIRQLMTGEMKLPPAKDRIAHEKTLKDSKIEETPLSTQIVKKISIHNERVPQTNNNVIPNPELSTNILCEDNSDEESEEGDDLPEDIKMIKEQARFLNKEDQIGFYEYQIEIVRQKTASLPQRSQKEIDEKIHLFNVLEHLEELLEMAETVVGNNEIAEQEKDEWDKKIKETDEKHERDKKIKETDDRLQSNEIPKKNNQKRRISFALEDDTLEFCKSETVIQMLSDKKDRPKRDVITLDNNICLNSPETIPTVMPFADKMQLIQARVEQNRQFVFETQSKGHFDLVNNILANSEGNINTLYISFKHSLQEPENIEASDNKDVDVPASPGDLYLKYFNYSKATEHSTLFINSYEGEDQVKIPILKEVDKQQAFENPKEVFSNPKSILRNRHAIAKENQFPTATPEGNAKKQKKRTPNEEEESMSAYNKVMNDVVEKSIDGPEPLPDGKFIDANTPKRRVSRFKQMRQGTEKT